MDVAFRDEFAVPPDVAYFNSASLGPPLKAVAAAGHHAIDWYDKRWQVGAADWFDGPERLRAAFADLAGVAADAVALVPSASYGIATAANNVPVASNDTIVLIAEQYPSNVYAWRRLAAANKAKIVTVERSANRTLTDALLSAIDSRTAVVAIPNCHWTDGELIDLVAVGAAARAVDAALVIDASQSLGIRPIDFDAVQPDFVACVGYKWLLGPYGLGYLIVNERWCEHGVPIEESWLGREGSNNFAGLVSYTDAYRPGARRFDCGENAQFINVPMATAAIERLNAWGRATIAAGFAERAARGRAVANALSLPALPPERSVEHILGIALPDIAAAERLATTLAGDSIFAGVRGSNLRLAPHLHTSDDDFDRLERALGHALG